MEIACFSALFLPSRELASSKSHARYLEALQMSPYTEENRIIMR